MPTAREMNRSKNEIVHTLHVPLIDYRQMYYLRIIANEGNLGETPEEIAAFYITDGIMKRQMSKVPIPKATTWKDFRP